MPVVVDSGYWETDYDGHRLVIEGLEYTGAEEVLWDIYHPPSCLHEWYRRITTNERKNVWEPRCGFEWEMHHVGVDAIVGEDREYEQSLPFHAGELIPIIHAGERCTYEADSWITVIAPYDRVEWLEHDFPITPEERHEALARQRILELSRELNA